MATSVQDAADQITEDLAELADEHEGYRDLELLNLQADTKQEVTASRQAADRRKVLLDAALAALLALIADGYPDLPVRGVPPAAYADIAAQHRTLTAALAKFEAQERAAALEFAAEVREKEGG